MGEKSKRNGERGEEIVRDFLKRIGWEPLITNEDIESYDEDFRKNHNGVDSFFHYSNPMISNTVNNVLCSVKFSQSKYSVNKQTVRNEFKEHFHDLVKAIESFKFSNLKKDTNLAYENMENDFDRGIVFWINAMQGTLDDKGKVIKHDIISEISGTQIDVEVRHDGVIVIDNARFDFFNQLMDFCELNLSTMDEVAFLYFRNSQNNSNEMVTRGKILPFEYLSSNVIPIYARKGNETTLILFTKEDFDGDSFPLLCGLAKNLSNGMQGKTVLCFPDYSETEHGQTVKLALSKFPDDRDFTSMLSVQNYRNQYRG